MKHIFRFILLYLFVSIPSAQAESFFVDIPEDHWGYPSAQYAQENNFFNIENKQFLPTQALTRGEVVQMILVQSETELITTIDTTSSFLDVQTGSSLFPYIETAYQNGIINGVGSGSFAPDQPVTRAQFLKILFETNQDVPPIDLINNFSDIQESHWAIGYISYATNKKLVSGINGEFKPDELVTRIQGAKILYQYAHPDNSTDQPNTKQSIHNTQAYETLLWSMINASRQEEGKEILILNSDLSTAARQHAQFLAENNLRSSHCGIIIEDNQECPETATPFARISDANIEYISAAENI
ncbi:MAG: S-layer homology domain-containing protein [Patescibacteria group bacterium]|nr:S-layer homology domain-containing protein [Patescibacteria group bacterium]